MTYVLMIWTVVACQAYSCTQDWREVMVFDYSRGAKTLCEETGKDLFDGRKYKCVQTK